MLPLDPIALSVFASRTMAISEEMGAHLGRTALSANIRDRRDYSCALFDRRGELIAQATHIPVHLGSMAYAMLGLALEYDWQPGDVMILNDPYRGGTHLPDVTMIQAIWTRSDPAESDPAKSDPAKSDRTRDNQAELIGFSACRAHYADIGAGETGSMGIADDLSQEGVLISPSMLIRQGEFQAQVIRPLLARVHDAALVHGDVRAQLSSCALGTSRLLALYEELERGRQEQRPGWLEHLMALQDYAERLAESALAGVADGVYRFTDYLDDDGHGHRDIPICAQIVVEQARMRIDFNGTAAMVKGNINCPLSVTAAGVFYVLRCLLPAHTPVCAGAMRPVQFSAPVGSLLNAQAPAAVALGNVETSSRIVDVLLGALAQAIPERIPAASQGTMNNLAMASRSPAQISDPEQMPWSYYETIAGGCGATAKQAGASAQHSHMTNTLNTPVEILERTYPMRVLSYEQRWSSGGAGAMPGGDGVRKVYEFLAPARVAILSERRRYQPWGLAGAAAGKAGQNSLNGTDLGGKMEFSVEAGDVLNIATPGGGGYGTV